MTDNKKKLKYGVNTTVAAFLVLGILIAVNIVGKFLFTRLDLTDSKEFTVSPATKRILSKLDDVVLAKVYFSDKLPDQLATLERNVNDLLKEFEVYSKGKLKIQFINPDETEDTKNQAIAMGIPQLQMNVLEKDQYQVMNVFMGIGLQSGEKVEALPVIQDLSNFEYDLAAAVVKLTSDKKYVVGVLQGSQERSLTTELTGMNQLLGERYEVRPVDLRGGSAPIPDDVDLLLIPGPKNATDRTKYEIDQFLMRGGKAMFLIDVITMNEQAGLQAFPARSGLTDLLAFYGVEVDDALVLEHPQYAARAQFSQGFMSYLVPYPYWPQAAPGLLSETHPITSKLESMILPWTAPLALTVPGDDAAQKLRESKGEAEPNLTLNQDQVEGAVLIRTTERAWTQSGRYDFNPQSPELRTVPETGQSYPIAVALSGTFKSFYAGKPIPAPPGEGEDPAAAPVSGTTIEQSAPTQVLVVGTSLFIVDQFLRMYPENSLFVQNATDWMTLGDDLIAIRSRGATARPLKEMSAGARDAIRWTNTLGVPILLILLGFVWNRARKQARKRLVERYAHAA